MKARWGSLTRQGQQLPLLLCLLLAAAGVLAQSPEKKALYALQERVQRMQQAQQAAEQEKTVLTGEKAALERQLLSVKAELARARTQNLRDAGELKELAGLRSEKDALAVKLGAAESKLSETLRKLELSGEAQSHERDSLLVAQRDLEQKGKLLATCETQNQALYKLNAGLLEQYVKSAASGARFLDGGVFTQFGRVRAENEATVCADKLDELRVLVKPAQ
jgi:chromosome segregation ATPase